MGDAKNSCLKKLQQKYAWKKYIFDEVLFDSLSVVEWGRNIIFDKTRPLSMGVILLFLLLLLLL